MNAETGALGGGGGVGRGVGGAGRAGGAFFAGWAFLDAWAGFRGRDVWPAAFLSFSRPAALLRLVGFFFRGIVPLDVLALPTRVGAWARLYHGDHRMPYDYAIIYRDGLGRLRVWCDCNSREAANDVAELLARGRAGVCIEDRAMTRQLVASAPRGWDFVPAGVC